MAEKRYVQRVIDIPSSYTPEEREAIAAEILERIRERSRKGIDKNGERFPGYSESYKKSLDFKNAGGASKPKLTLSGDMLAMLDLVSHKKGKLIIGYDPSDPEADVAEGNIRGSYGQPTGSKKKARDFLGIPKSELESILAKYPLDDDEARTERAAEVLASESFEVGE